MKRKWMIGTLIAVSISVSAVMVRAQLSQDFSEDLEQSTAGRALMQVYGALRSNYLEDVDEEKVLEGAIQGMLEALDDPYTSYTTPERAARSRQDLSGEFEGIGAVLQPRNRQDSTMVEIINVYRDGPAWNAGVQRGDVFVEIDGENVEAEPIDEIVNRVRGPRGTVVELGMRRPGEDELVYFEIERDRIEIVSVESSMLPDNVGYITINTFGNQRVSEQLNEQLGALRAEGATSLVLDLRDNPGGLLPQGIMVADTFLDEGDILYHRARGVTQRYASADPDTFFDLPMVVLVNNNSASASEIVAGALQDNGRALVVGEETFGKGVGQSVMQLNNGGQLTLLSFEWLTPSRRSINQQGVLPDVKAIDTRFPNVISLEGGGADPGAEIEFVVDGEVVGKATANDDGEFSFFQSRPRREVSEVRGEALVDLDSDDALKAAYDTVLQVLAGDLAPSAAAP